MNSNINKLPQAGEDVIITLSNMKSPMKTGPLAVVTPDTFDVVGKIAAKPRTDRDPNNFSVLVMGSMVPLRVIDIRNVLAIDGVALKQGKVFTKQTFTIEGSKGAQYSVTFDGKMWICNCPAGQHRKPCRHIDEARGQLK
jgi:hypothetical protein